LEHEERGGRRRKEEGGRKKEEGGDDHADGDEASTDDEPAVNEPHGNAPVEIYSPLNSLLKKATACATFSA
ncbi:hypothetical protein KI387_005735, partial [Taxus chinensis]